MLGSCALFFGEFGECFALLGERLQQRSGAPGFARLLVKFADAIVNILQTHSIRIPHRAATIGRETVAVEIDDIDVHGAKGKTFFEDARTFVDERVEAAIYDFLSADLALRNVRFGNPACNEPNHLRVRSWPTLFIVSVPAGTCFLAVAAELTEIIFAERLPNAGLLQVTIFLAHAPTHVEAREVAGGERSHGHAEAAESFIDGFDADACFSKELGFGAIWAEHAVADKTQAIAAKHCNFAALLGKLHTGGNDFLGCSVAAHDFEETHDVGRAKEHRPDDEFRARRAGRDLVDA